MKRGQLQVMEPIIIVIVLALIIGIGLLFYVRVNEGQHRQDRTIARQQEDLETLSLISRMPELSCSSDVSATNCIDLRKAQSFGAITRNDRVRLYYYPYFGEANVSVTWIDLSTGVPKTLVLYANLEADTYAPTTTYFTIYDPIDGTFKHATLRILRRTR